MRVGRYLGISAVLWCMLAAASGVARAQVEVTDAWVRATVPGQKVAAAYMSLRAATAGKLVGVETKAARSAEIHTMSHEGGVMKMRRLDALELPAGQTVALEPGGNHLMLFDPVNPLTQGQRVSLKLIFEQAGKRVEVAVDAPVRSPGTDEGAHKHH